MRLNSLRAIAMMVVATLASSIACARPLNLNDLLTAGNVGTVDIDPAGRRLAFEFMPSYEHQANFALVDTVGFDRTGLLYLYDFASGASPKPLEVAKSEGMWSGGFSPHGTRLLVLWRAEGTVRVGTFDFATQTLTPIPVTPDVPFNTIAWSLAFSVWLSEDELILATVPRGEQPVGAGLRYAPALELMRQWQDTWHGEKPAVTITRSGAKELDGGVQGGTLVRVDARNGAVLTLATGRYLCLSLSPDGRYLAAMRVGMSRPPEPDMPLKRSSIDMYRSQPVLFDLRSDTEPPLELGKGMEAANNSFVFSAKGDRLSFFAWPAGEPMQRGSFQLFDIAHKKRRAVAPMGLDLVAKSPSWVGFPQNAIPFSGGLAIPARLQADPKAPQTLSVFGVSKARIDWFLASPDGKVRNLTADLEGVSPAPLHAGADGLLVLAKDGIWRIRADGQRTNLTTGITGTLINPRRVGDFVVADVSGDVSGFVAIELATGKAKVFARSGKQTDRALAVAPATGTAIVRVNGYRPWALKAIAADGVEKSLWTWNAHFAGITAPRSVTLNFKSSDGRPMEATAVLPADWTPERRAPAIAWVYPTGNYTPPKPNAPARPGELDGGLVIPAYAMELLNSMGYIVLYPKAPNDMLRSEDGNPLGNWGKLTMAAVDELVAHGYADRERIGLYGASQGSWSALSVVTQTTRLKAAVVAYGVADFISHYGTAGIMRYYPNDLENPRNPRFYRYESDRGYPQIGAMPWDDPTTYIKASPLFSVRKIETPLLLLHTDLDIAGFPMEQFDEMFAALSRLGKDAVYLRYWGEGHGLTSPANIRDQWSRIFAWYDKCLDISRDADAHIVYDGATPRSRGGGASWEPARYLALEGWGH